jgi:hypothetical protein
MMMKKQKMTAGSELTYLNGKSNKSRRNRRH